MASMSVEQREAFLADLHVGVLAIEHAGHGPLAIPIWYLFEDGAVQILMDGGSLKAKLLRAAGQATLTVQRETPPYQYVSVEGPVVVESGNAIRLKMATRYLGEKAGREYAAGSNSPDAVVVTLTPTRWRSVDYGG